MQDISTALERARCLEREYAGLAASPDRPLAHLTPLVGWMNDPNGFCYFGGCYHLFYQYHPYSRVWGPMHWGHAVSEDLIHWRYEPCALAPDTPADTAGCFSGSAVPLPDGRLMLAYTGVQPATDARGALQAQCVAFGDGRDFVKADANPVLTLDGLDKAYSRQDFRDPKIWLDKDGLYYMVVGCRHRERAGTVLLFASENGLAWSFLGEIDSSRGEYGRMWECPDFFPLDGSQVLLVSPQEMLAVEEFHAGNGTAAFIGSYDKASHCFTRSSVQPVDLGLNFYAPQTVQAPDGRRILIGWMENWETCDGEPRPHSWYGQMTLPRELHLSNGHLCQQPVREIAGLWQDTITYHDVPVHEECELPGVRGRLMDLTVALSTKDTSCRRFELRVAKGHNRFAMIRCDLDHGEITFDRSHSGTLRDIVHTRQVKAEPQNGALTLRLILDKESVELFINDGRCVLTSLISTELTAEGITFAADSPIHMTVEAHHLG